MSPQHPAGVPPHVSPYGPASASVPPQPWTAAPAGAAAARGAGSSWAPRPVPPALGTASVVLAALVAAAQVAAFALSFPVVSTLRDLVAGRAASSGVLGAYDATTYLYSGIQVAAAVVTVVWLWRSRTFAEAVSPDRHHARSRVWVWLGWILPVVSLWFPYQVVRDVRAATSRAERPGLGVWWAAWLVAGFAANTSGRVLASRDPGDWSALPLLDGVATVAIVVAAVLWARVVREVTAGQRAAVSPR